MQFLAQLSIQLNRLICYVGRASTWCALALMLVVMFDVVSRRFFVLGSTKLQELEWHLHIVLFAFCLAYGYLANTHVRIDLFRGRLPERTQHWIEVIGCALIVVPYCAILVYFGTHFAVESFTSGESSSAGTGLPHRWIIKMLLTVGLGTLLLSGISVIAHRLVLLFGTDEQQEQVASELQNAVGLAPGTVLEDATH